MRFIKENIYDIVKLFINHIGVTIFSFFLYTAVGMIKEDSMKVGVNVGVSIVSIVFLLFLLYTVAWEWGAKDKIRIDGGRLKCNKYKGLFISLYSNVFNFLIALVSFVTVLAFMLKEPTNYLFDTSLVITLDKVNSNWLLGLHSVFNIFMRFISSLYNGLLRGIFSGMPNAFLASLYESIGFFLLPITSVIATHIGYNMGLKEKKLFAVSKKK